MTVELHLTSQQCEATCSLFGGRNAAPLLWNSLRKTPFKPPPYSAPYHHDDTLRFRKSQPACLWSGLAPAASRRLLCTRCPPSILFGPHNEGIPLLLLIPLTPPLVVPPLLQRRFSSDFSTAGEGDVQPSSPCTGYIIIQLLLLCFPPLAREVCSGLSEEYVELVCGFRCWNTS